MLTSVGVGLASKQNNVNLYPCWSRKFFHDLEGHSEELAALVRLCAGLRSRLKYARICCLTIIHAQSSLY